jgi:hypothetical protein
MRNMEEMEQIVVMQRLSLYNQGFPCGAKAIREYLNSTLDINPLPSERTIGRILARHGVTHSRTGWYEGES